MLSHKSLWLVALYYDFFFYILNISFYVSLNSPSMVTLYCVFNVFDRNLFLVSADSPRQYIASLCVS